MNTSSKVFVAGHNGLVGSALVRTLESRGYGNLVTRSRSELDLTDKSSVEEFFASDRPEYVILAAAKVGGIHANNTYPADFIQRNLEIQTNVIDSAMRYGVKRLLALGSTCIYPKECPQPIKEEYLLTGPLEPTNSAYAVAKIAGIEMCRSYNKQHGTSFACVMPTNLYGVADNYHPQNSHVMPALIRRFHESKVRGDAEAIVWGTGKPRREFLYADDMAEACVFLMELPDDQWTAAFSQTYYPLLNVGYGDDVEIGEVSRLIAETVGFTGRLVNDTSKPDGTFRKLTDSSRLFALGWRPKVTLADGLKRAYADFCERLASGTLREV